MKSRKYIYGYAKMIAGKLNCPLYQVYDVSRGRIWNVQIEAELRLLLKKRKNKKKSYGTDVK